MHVVVVGGGFAGMEVAAALRGSCTRVTLIDRHNYTLFQPLLYQVATAALSPADVAVPIRTLLRAPNVEILLDEVTAVIPDRRCVTTSAGREIAFDALIVATGSQYDYFGRPEWGRFAPSLKSLDDAVAIRRRLLLAFEAAEMCGDDDERRALMTLIVIGAGPTGVEMAGALAELAKATLARDFRRIDPAAARVLLIEAGPKILAAFPERLSTYARQALSRLGVEVMLDTPIEQIDEFGVVAGGSRIAARVVLWAAGVKASPVASWLGVAAGPRGAVPVNSDFSVPGRSDIFVIGDAAIAIDLDGRALPGLAAVAKQEGQYVGRLLLARSKGSRPPPAFVYRDYGMMATIGRSAAVADLRGFRLTGVVAWLLWGAVHLYYLIGFRNRLVVLVDWFWAWLTYARGARLITGEFHAVPTCDGGAGFAASDDWRD